MADAVLAASPWIALGAGVLGVVLVAWHARGTWRTWRRTRVTQQAASGLLDVHAQRLDETLQLLDRRMGTVADDGEQLATALGELRAEAAHLRWMLGRIPDERERLTRELYELVLPTGGDRARSVVADEDA